MNGQDVCEKTLDEVNQVLQESWQRIKIEIEFDVADSVMASSGTFVVKLPRKPGGIGITLSGKYLIEFDVADSVMASSRTFVVKLHVPHKLGGIGITLSGECGKVSEVTARGNLIDVAICFA